jgi:NAD+ diphosphatase
VVRGGQEVLLAGPATLARLPLRAVPQDAPLILLGLELGDVALFAYDAGERAGGYGDGTRFASLREIAADLDSAEGGLAAYAVALAGWHRNHGHCARCGAQTVIEQAGHSRRCPVCGAHHFPRTDPVVTMLVHDADRCLLTRRRGAPAGRWSALAGFVEPGETPEEAVVRETREEVGLTIVELRYVGAQPWPFPASLMLGYRARVDPDTSSEPVVDQHELLDARWFTRGELQAAIDDGTATLPPAAAIGHFLIAGWLAAGT